jgi:hypothetical protein
VQCTFDPNGPYLGQGYLYGGVLGDVNGDHHVDILASYYDHTTPGVPQPIPVPTTALLEGDGKGGFGTASPIAALAGSSPYLIVDLDQDGFPDVAVSPNTWGATVGPGPGSSVFWGDATMSFSASSPLPVTSAFDFDNDGNLDVLIDQGPNHRCILFGAGGRVWGQRMLITPVPLFHPSYDFNNDGVPDAMYYDYPSQTISIYVSTAKQTPPGPPDVYCNAKPSSLCVLPNSF